MAPFQVACVPLTSTGKPSAGQQRDVGNKVRVWTLSGAANPCQRGCCLLLVSSGANLHCPALWSGSRGFVCCSAG